MEFYGNCLNPDAYIIVFKEQPKLALGVAVFKDQKDIVYPINYSRDDDDTIRFYNIIFERIDTPYKLEDRVLKHPKAQLLMKLIPSKAKNYTLEDLHKTFKLYKTSGDVCILYNKYVDLSCLLTNDNGFKDLKTHVEGIIPLGENIIISGRFGLAKYYENDELLQKIVDEQDGLIQLIVGMEY